jgi:hypothetical protein
MAVATVEAQMDDDSLAQERDAAPKVLEAIAGHFPQHSEAYYRWQVSHCQAAIREGNRDLPVLDALAIAFDRLGEHESAIEVIAVRSTIKTDYDSEARWGAYLLRAGKVVDGLKHLAFAAELDADGNAGRERYRTLFVGYSRQTEEDKWDNFAEYVLDHRRLRDSPERWAKEKRRAVRGLVEMMLDGDHQSPAVLAALADLLMWGEGAAEQHRRLAIMALMRAAAHAPDDETRRRYDEAATVIAAQVGGYEDGKPNVALEAIAEDLKWESDRGAELNAQIHKQEAAWIAAGLDVAEKYRQTYEK